MVWVEIHPYRLPHAYKFLYSLIIVQPDGLVTTMRRKTVR